jgi:hypothetical protein
MSLDQSQVVANYQKILGEIEVRITTLPSLTDEKVQYNLKYEVLGLITGLCNQMAMTPDTNPMEYIVNKKIDVPPYNLGKAILEYIKVKLKKSPSFNDNDRAYAINAYRKLIEALPNGLPNVELKDYLTNDVVQMLSDESPKVRLEAIGAYRSIIEKTDLFNYAVIQKINQMTQDTDTFVADAARIFNKWFNESHTRSIVKMLSDKSAKARTMAIEAYRSIVEKTNSFNDDVIQNINKMAQDPDTFLARAASDFIKWFNEYEESLKP